MEHMIMTCDEMAAYMREKNITQTCADCGQEHAAPMMFCADCDWKRTIMDIERMMGTGDEE